MKLSTYAKQLGITYRTAWQYWKNGLIKGHQLPTGTIIIDDGIEKIKNNNVDINFIDNITALINFFTIKIYNQKISKYKIKQLIEEELKNV